MEIIDQYGRSFTTLRVSLLNACNLQCAYCVDQSAAGLSPKPLVSALSVTDLLARIASILKTVHIQTIRLTGGEPLLYKEIFPFIEGLKNLAVDDIRITTNGYFLKELAPRLAESGVRSINVSLDAVTEESFRKISKRKQVDKILNGIELATRSGMSVKLNAVIMRGFNETEILPLFDYAHRAGLPIRYLELMKMGHLFTDKGAEDSYFFSEKDILATIASRYHFNPCNRKPSATANEWMLDDGYRFGIIANESAPFCSDCNRLRIDSFGNIFGCLSSNEPVAIGPTDDQEVLDRKLSLALSHKQDKYFRGSSLSMLSIGG